MIRLTRFVIAWTMLAALLLGARPVAAQWLSEPDLQSRASGASEEIYARTVPDDSGPEGSPLGALLGYWFDSVRSLGLGVDVGPLRNGLRAAPTLVTSAPGTPGTGTQRPLETDLRGSALSFDLRLRWPSATGMESPLQPYMSFGPALLLSEPDRAAIASLVGNPRDVTVSLGVKGGAGVTWQFDKNGTFFSEYRFIRGSQDSGPLFGTRGSATETTGFDVLYGVRFKF